MRRNRIVYMLLVALCSSPSAAAVAAPEEGSSSLFQRYGTIWKALVHDTTEGVAGAALEMSDLAERLAVAESGDAEEHLEAVRATALELGAAEGLAATRDAFYELSKAMIRYRETVPGSRPMVVYCPMAKRSWLQPDGEIGNPYYGQSMAKCGDIVDPAR